MDVVDSWSAYGGGLWSLIDLWFVWPVIVWVNPFLLWVKKMGFGSCIFRGKTGRVGSKNSNLFCHVYSWLFAVDRGGRVTVVRRVWLGFDRYDWVWVGFVIWFWVKNLKKYALFDFGFVISNVGLWFVMVVGCIGEFVIWFWVVGVLICRGCGF